MFRTVLIVLVLLGGCGPAGEAPGRSSLEITEARVRAVIPGQDRTAAYFTAHNASGATVTLTGARGSAAGAVEMHVSVREGDQMRMARLEKVEIAPGDTVRFEPGGRHLMLFDVEQLGDSTEIVLEHDGSETRVRFQTVAIGGA